jgi:hypothetical protein
LEEILQVINCHLKKQQNDWFKLYGYKCLMPLATIVYCISVVMVSILTSSAVDCGFKPRSGQTKDDKIGICCFSAKHVGLVQSEPHHLIEN